MKFNLPLSGLLLFVFCADVLAEGPEDQYIRVYSLIQQADILLGKGEDVAALNLYHKAQGTLAQAKAGFVVARSRLESALGTP